MPRRAGERRNGTYYREPSIPAGGTNYFDELGAESDLLGRVVLRGCCFRLHSPGFDVGSQCFDVMAVGTRNEVAVEVHSDLDGRVRKISRAGT